LIVPSLLQLAARQDFELRVIGAPEFSVDGLDVTNIVWSEETEAKELAIFDVGIMPLPNEDFERGKSALKLIQYFAVGIPAVASPVGANCDVIDPGINGFLAENVNDWVAGLSTLLGDHNLRQEMGTAGRSKVESLYSVQANFPLWLEILRQYAGLNSRSRYGYT
jgi:glycosyltransferase involved in cell wall biosynthesis